MEDDDPSLLAGVRCWGVSVVGVGYWGIHQEGIRESEMIVCDTENFFILIEKKNRRSFETRPTSYKPM